MVNEKKILNKFTDDEFRKYMKDINDEVIDNIIAITQKDREYCEMLIETEEESIIHMMERIPEVKRIIEEYKVKRKECHYVLDKLESTETKLVMILRQITGIDFNRCRSLFEEDDELIIKIMKYINKIEGKIK